MASSIEMWNNAELTSLEEWRVPSPSAVYQPELFGAGLDASKLPPSTILTDGSVGAMQRDAARPASPGTVETMASKLRSLSFAAGRPRTGEAAGRAAQYVAAGDALKEQLRSQQSERLRQVAPALAGRLDAALLASCGVLLATEHADGGFEWASWHIEQLRRVLPHHEAAFPGAYYREIFGADVTQLATSLAEVAHATSRRRAAAADALDAIVRCEGASAARLESAAQAAEAVGAEEEGRSARAVAKLATRATEAEQRVQAVEAELHALKRSGSDATAGAKRAGERERELEARLKAAEDGRNALQLKLTVEAESRRRVEAASVKTLEQLKVQEEARWAAERLLQQESARLAEMTLLHRRADEEASGHVADAEHRSEKQAAEAQASEGRYLEAERQKVALGSRVTSLEGLKAQLEQQLRLEREVGDKELRTRQQAEQSLDVEARELAAAREASVRVEAELREAQEELHRVQAELQATDARLSVANEQGLQLHVETASTEEALQRLKELRGDEQGRAQQLNADKAALQQAKADLEARLRAAALATERQAQEGQAQRYELQAQLTEAHRKLESAQAGAVRAEMYLEREMQSGTTAADASGRMHAQLDDEKRGRQALAQQLAAEQALRQQALAGQQGMQRELAVKVREADVAVQRLHQMQAELQLARTEAHETREVSELRHAVQRERDRISGLPQKAAGHPREAPFLGGVHAALIPQTQLGRSVPPSYKSSAPPPSYDDDLGGSDIWDFSAGAMARQGRGGSRVEFDLNTALPRIRSPYNTGSANGHGR